MVNEFKFACFFVLFFKYVYKSMTINVNSNIVNSRVIRLSEKGTLNRAEFDPSLIIHILK